MPSVLFVSYSGLFGGAERVLLDAAAAMGAPTVLACPPGPLLQAAGRAGLSTICLPSRSLRVRGGALRRLEAVAGLAGHAGDIRRLARDLEPELIVSWGMRSAIAALLLPRGARWAFEHHDLLPSPGVAKLVRWAARRAALVTVPSVAVQADLDPGAQISKRIRVIAPGVDLSRFADLGDPTDGPGVLVLGALAAWKQPLLALEIIALARRAIPGVRLSVVGGPITPGDPLESELRRRASQPDLIGAVAFRGAVPDPRRELERALCLLHCAPAEPFGLVILEALACGRPVVVADAGGPLEIVDATCAELYTPGDAQAGAEALVRLLRDPARARTMGAAGRARVRSTFTSARTREGFRNALTPLRRTSGPDRHQAARAGDLTLVTVSYNSATELARLIASRDAHLPGTPMIVVDCASTDTSLAVAAAGADVTIMPLETNVGFGTACNRGLAGVTSPTVALVNPDVELIDDSILELAGEALRPDRPQRLLSPLVLNVDGTRQETAHPRPTSLPDLVRTLVPPALVPTPWLAPWRARRPRRVGWVVGAALVAGTTTLRSLGPYDESIFMYGEDMDLGLKAAAAGVSTWFWPSSRVLHAGAHSTDRAFGGEAFARLAQARHETVVRQLGPRRGRIDRFAQTVTFISRIGARTALGRSAQRERRQLAAVRGLDRP